ncbi:hypothetical protein K439DRAFT_1371858 [Ramaria rubella]|nr:hypothetical protein K439DRAFT_1371858 [Ramaria rubella]
MSASWLAILDTYPDIPPHPDQGGECISEGFLGSMQEAECIWRFCFTVDELIAISELTDLPDPLITRNGYKASVLECLGLLCAHLQSPEDQHSLSMKYACSQSVISEITNRTAAHIDAHWLHLLDWDHEGVVSPAALQSYVDALSMVGAPSWSIFGYLDCMICQTCHLSYHQHLVYMGYKKYHGMKFQAMALPNGLIGHLSGPFCAPQNDTGVLAESNLLMKMALHMIQAGSHAGDPPGWQFFQVYGDSAYSVSPFARVVILTVQETAWNTAMGGVWISVEHVFGLVLQDWPYLNTFWKQKIYSNACRLFYQVAVILTNAHACLVPNQTMQRYNCMPPKLHEYFHH